MRIGFRAAVAGQMPRGGASCGSVERAISVSGMPVAVRPRSGWTTDSDYIANSPGFHQGFTRAGYKTRVRFQNPTLTAAEKIMLVLTRKLGESIHIGADVVLTVLDVRPGRIRLGIAAPLSVRIQRGELCDSRESQTGTDFLRCQSCEDTMKIANFGDLGLKAIRPAAFRIWRGNDA